MAVAHGFGAVLPVQGANMSPGVYGRMFDDLRRAERALFSMDEARDR